MIDIDVTIPNQTITLTAEANVTSRDYEKLKNIPTLNGKPFIGNVQEEDPTVPAWAKSAEKPAYSAQEIGAVSTQDAISLAEINELFNMVFS